eukprot:CAMPEP_0172443972 /NCGR_PEP_ID=MMETSP1065-20121228/4143_1 /TAXON_ID=265537 /ORGANISM="Amphiprora paludosa, Strain CCMP125" /LENGTH=1927 /DNA_ID=CAMNT_0013194385 /DNA_START=54 /DNA_END=5837 /DNA_ORIENTATION=-
MGRPSITGGRTRAAVAKACEEDDTSLSSPMFKRRFPRMGSLFQAKVPEGTTDTPYKTDRPSPAIMSTEVPYLTQDEYNTLNMDRESADGHLIQHDGPAEMASNMVVATKTATSTDLRGLYVGLFSNPIVLPKDETETPSTPTNHSTTDRDQQHKQWTTSLLDWYDAHEKKTQVVASSRGRKSRFKRPRDVQVSEVPDLPVPPRKVRALDLNDAGSGSTNNNNSNNNNHEISPQQEEWRLLVDLSAGQAVKRIRERKRKLALDPLMLKTGEPQPNESVWRDLCQEERRDTTSVTLTGDYRMEKAPSSWVSRQSSYNGSSPEQTWKAVLGCANAYLNQMSSGPPMPAQTILSFCQNAARLLPPEKIWTYSDPMVKDINAVMDSLMEAVKKARRLRAEWMDLWFQDGVELDVLRKSLKSSESMMVQPDEYDELNRQLKVVMEWQSRVDQARTSPRSGRNDMEEVEAFCDEARAVHAFRSKGLVTLETKLQKSEELTQKIADWKDRIAQKAPCENLKYLSALVRDITRLKLKFPAAAFALELSETTDAWVERANIAIRSRISLTEIKSLIERGQEIPLDLSDFIEKLKSRQAVAEEWLDRLSFYVPAPGMGYNGSLVDWMRLVRTKLDEGGKVVTSMHDLACEGNRIPVEMDCVKLLQIELDARNWCIKARKWTPDETNPELSRKGKIDDIRDHVEKATALRQRLVLPAKDKERWELDGESDLLGLISRVDEWFETYKEFIEGDCRRSDGRAEVSIAKLREIVQKGDAIQVNFGPASLKMAKVLSQAEKWYAKYESLVVACRPGEIGEKVALKSLKEAVEDANENVGVLDLKEANDLGDMVERIESWFERATVAIGGKKLRGKQKLVFGVKDLNALIEEGRDFPVQTSTEISQLESLVGAVLNWQSFAKRNMETIAGGFQLLKEVVNSKYGEPTAFIPQLMQDAVEAPKDTKTEGSQVPSEKMTALGEAVEADSGPPTPSNEISLSNECDTLIKIISQDSKNSCIVTPEADVAQHLEEVSRWIARSLKYVENRKEILDSRFFGAFDRFLKEGETLLQVTNVPPGSPTLEASRTWRGLIEDQLKRMDVLLAERGAFSRWCNRAQEIISGNDKKATIEKLREIVKEGASFPPDNETVANIRNLTEKCNQWIESTASALESDEKIPFSEAKIMLEEGNRLGILSKELRALRNGVKAARSWSNKLKKLSPDQAQAKSNLVQILLDEYEDMMISLPEEHKRLSHSVKNYCLCRRPFEGFMVKCEKCNDFYHGACVGISQARAEKKPIDNYVCVRCLVEKVFQASNSCIAGILRKWTSGADLKKARLADFQKQQRKTRRETKELEKLRMEAQKLSEEVAKLNETPPAAVTAAPVAPATTVSAPDAPAQVQVGPEGAVSEPEKQPEPATKSREELGRSIEKVTAAIKLCQSRLQDLHEAAVRLRNDEELENVKAEELKRWSIRVRSLILAPSSEELARRGRPLANGTLSPAMIGLMQEAEKYGLLRYADVKTVFNSFKCICWSAQAMDILARRPKASDTVAIVRQASKLKLPDEKGLRMMKSMAQRATSWNFKASRILMPIPGEKRRYDLKELRNLSNMAGDIPLRMSLEPRVDAVIEDDGVRHCVCGGPSDGRMMLCCDKCDIWFHSHCVGLSTEEANKIEEWVCPPCKGLTVDVSPDVIRGFHDAFGKEEDDSGSTSDDDDVSSKAPQTEKLWPPFGLLGDSRANESLGQNLCAFPEDVGLWDGTLQCAPVRKPEMKTVAPASTQQVRSAVSAIQKPPPQQRVPVPVAVQAPVPPRIHVVSSSGRGSVQLAPTTTAAKPAPTTTAAMPAPTTTAAMPALANSAIKVQERATPLNQPQATAANVVQQLPPMQLKSNENVIRAHENGTRPQSLERGSSRQPSEQVGNVSADEGIHESVAQLLAMRDVMVAPVQDNGFE